MINFLNTSPVYFQKSVEIDEKAGLIRNVIVAQEGVVKGHGEYLDKSFISDLVSLANQTKPGIKARFGHPNICATALGTYLGRFKNFRVEGISAVADMHLDKVAIKSPSGDLYSYVMDMAKNNPDMFGASIAFKKGKFREGTDADGNKIKLSTIKSLYAADFVDSPAATDGLFDLFHQDDLASQVTMFLDQNPQVFELISKKPDILDDFIIAYQNYKTNNMSKNPHFSKIKDWLSDTFSTFFQENAPDTPSSVIEDLRADFLAQLTTLQTSFESEIKTLKADAVVLKSQLAIAKAKPTALPNSTDPAVSAKPKVNPAFSALAGMPKSLKRRLNIKS